MLAALLAPFAALPAPAHTCLPAREDPILRDLQRARVEQARTASAALATVSSYHRVHPETWRSLSARFPEAASVRVARWMHGPSPHDADGRSAAEVWVAIGDPSAFTTRAEGLLDAHANARALMEAEYALKQVEDPSLRCRLAYVQGKAARKLRRYGAAEVLLASAEERCEGVDPERLLRVLLLQARIGSIRGKPQAIARAAERIRARAPEHSYWDDAMLWLGEAQEARAPAKAESTYAKMLEEAPHGDMAFEAAWRRADLARKAPRRFAARLRDALAAARAQDDRDQARYWLAQATDDEDEAAALRTQLARGYGFYGHLALQQLPESRRAAITAELVAASAAVAATPLPLPEHPEIERALRIENAAYAAAVLRGWACSASPSAHARLAVADWLQKRGQPAAAQRILRPAQDALLGPALTAERARAWRVAYSRAFETELRAAAEAEALDPFLLMALAREESRFDPAVRSWAGATGLTQLMPATAEAAHLAVFRRPLERAVALEDPRLNARLGAFVLAEGLEAQGSVPLALSHYNAGPGLTARFVRAGAGPFDAFVERISVAQTRGYVKRVTESWLRYRLLYAPTEPMPQLPATVGRSD